MEVGMLHLCQFHTDQGIITASGRYARGQIVPDTLTAEFDQLTATIGTDAIDAFTD